MATPTQVTTAPAKQQLRHWNEGVSAFHNGLERKDCPYRLIGLRAQAFSDLGRKRADWINGFNFAHEQDVAS